MSTATRDTFATECDYQAYLASGGRPITHNGRPPEAIGRTMLRRRREADWLLRWRANPMLAIERLLHELAGVNGGMTAADFASGEHIGQSPAAPQRPAREQLNIMVGK